MCWREADGRPRTYYISLPLCLPPVKCKDQQKEARHTGTGGGEKSYEADAAVGMGEEGVAHGRPQQTKLSHMPSSVLVRIVAMLGGQRLSPPCEAHRLCRHTSNMKSGSGCARCVRSIPNQVASSRRDSYAFAATCSRDSRLQCWFLQRKRFHSKTFGMVGTAPLFWTSD